MAVASVSERGRILVGLCGYYDVLLSDGRTVPTVARGRFRREGKKPLAGDEVCVEKNDEKQGVYGAITDILPRRNFFVRPPVANVDRMLVFVPAGAPKPDFLLIDRLIVQAAAAGVETALCLSKRDAACEGFVEEVLREYAAFRVLVTSSETGEGIGDLRALLEGAVTAVAGQSGAGKSSLLNAAYPRLNLEVGRLSERIERGRHTTRMSVLLPLPGGGFVVDTPGFSLIESEPMAPWLLKDYYPEFAHLDGCRFGADCLHAGEPGCAADFAALPAGRMARYVRLLDEYREKWKNRYTSGG